MQVTMPNSVAASEAMPRWTSISRPATRKSSTPPTYFRTIRPATMVASRYAPTMLPSIQTKWVTPRPPGVRRRLWDGGSDVNVPRGAGSLVPEGRDRSHAGGTPGRDVRGHERGRREDGARGRDGERIRGAHLVEKAAHHPPADEGQAEAEGEADRGEGEPFPEDE